MKDIDPGAFTRIERILQVLLLMNVTGAIALAVWGSWWRSGVLDVVLLLFWAVGLTAAALMRHRRGAALICGALFYLPQCLTYAGPEGLWALRSGLHVSLSFPIDNGMINVNVLASALVLMHLRAAAQYRARMSRVLQHESVV